MKNTEHAKILIVDDRQDNIFAMEQLLSDMEIDIFTAQSGNEALKLMLTTEFALVLLDVQMPEMDGFETATLMRENDQTKGIPIIFVTAISKEDRHVFKGYDSGAVDYLFKPVNPEILRSKVRVFCQLYLSKLECRKMERELQQSRNLDAIGELASGIAHDFNNLLTSIMGSIELVSMMMPQEKVQKLLGRAMRSSLQAEELARRLISFSKGGVLNLREIAVGKVIRDTADTVLAGSPISFNYSSIPDDLPHLKVDESQITRLFYNLFLNAREAMPKGGTLSVTAKYFESMTASSEKGQLEPYVKISVEDNGTGITKENLPRIFEPYFTTKQKGKQKGLGLGLAICYSIAKKHGGSLTVQSRIGKGTVFQISLPLSPEISSKKSIEKEEEAVNKVRILVYDADELIRYLAADLLGALGYNVELAASVHETLEKYEQSKAAGSLFDAVFLGVSSHDTEKGFNTLNRLLAVDSQARVVASIDSTGNSPMIDFKKSGFSAVITKPYGMGDLANTMHNLLPPLNFNNGFYDPS
ncbi:MAG: response regulator [Desulfobulbaceae bacterium]|nr:response regulator [Desulfobulbaceae bacterium]